MERISNQKKLRPWMGVLVQAAALGLFVTVGAYESEVKPCTSN